jgi:hypothetical protein
VPLLPAAVLPELRHHRLARGESETDRLVGSQGFRQVTTSSDLGHFVLQPMQIYRRYTASGVSTS